MNIYRELEDRIQRLKMKPVAAVTTDEQLTDRISKLTGRPLASQRQDMSSIVGVDEV